MSEEQKCTCPLCGKEVKIYLSTSKEWVPTLNLYKYDWIQFECMVNNCKSNIYFKHITEAEARARFMQRPESDKLKEGEILYALTRALNENYHGGARAVRNDLIVAIELLTGTTVLNKDGPGPYRFEKQIEKEIK